MTGDDRVARIEVRQPYDADVRHIGRSAVFFPAPKPGDPWPTGVFLWFEQKHADFDADVAKLAEITGLPVVLQKPTESHVG